MATVLKDVWSAKTVTVEKRTKEAINSCLIFWHDATLYVGCLKVKGVNKKYGTRGGGSR